MRSNAARGQAHMKLITIPRGDLGAPARPAPRSIAAWLARNRGSMLATMAFNKWRRRPRVMITVVATLVAAGMTLGLSATSNAEDVGGTGREQRNAELVRDAFGRGVGDEASFYSILAEDVQWTVARAVGPRTYTSRSEFLRDGAGPIQSRINGPIQANVRQLITDDDVVVAVWDGTATALDGLPYVNSYTWVMTMRDERVVRVTAFLDFVALNGLLERVTPR